MRTPKNGRGNYIIKLVGWAEIGRIHTKPTQSGRFIERHIEGSESRHKVIGASAWAVRISNFINPFPSSKLYPPNAIRVH